MIWSIDYVVQHINLKEILQTTTNVGTSRYTTDRRKQKIIDDSFVRGKKDVLLSAMHIDGYSLIGLSKDNNVFKTFNSRVLHYEEGWRRFHTVKLKKNGEINITWENSEKYSNSTFVGVPKLQHF